MTKKVSVVQLIITIVLVLVCISFAVVIIVKLSDKPTDKPENVGAMVKEVPADEDFTWTAPDLPEQEPATMEVAEPAVEPDKGTAASLTRGLDEMPEEILNTKGYKDYMASEYSSGEQTRSVVEEGNSCKVYIMGDYRVIIHWIYGAGDCSVYVLSIDDANIQLAFFGREV